jgi:hypothetical protein
MPGPYIEPETVLKCLKPSTLARMVRDVDEFSRTEAQRQGVDRDGSSQLEIERDRLRNFGLNRFGEKCFGAELSYAYAKPRPLNSFDDLHVDALGRVSIRPS